MTQSPTLLQDPSKGLLCPVCRVALVMTDRQNVEIDYCPTCRGVWLDRGELDKIIERSLPQGASASGEQGLSGSGGDQRQGHGGGGKHGGGGHGSSGYRRKSWLSEIFD